MTQQYDNRNSGALFPNDRKTKQSHPDYKGTMTDADGQEFWISAWVKQGRKGEFLSLAFEKKEDRPAEGPRTLGGSTPKPSAPKQNRNPPPADLDDDLPF
ncbi:ssDNA binding protein [Acinetobacter phage SH-Ab 15497]|nr:ssDNA binding protein [Acinetobacter phage SH-Ab 15497]